MVNTQQISDPIGVSKLTAQAIGLEAIDHRRGQGALSQASTGATSGTVSGVFPGGTSGAGVSDDLKGYVSSGLTVTHNPGHFGIDRGSGSLYLGYAYGAASVTLDQGDANNPRIDLLVMRLRDPGVDSGVTESAKIVVLKGTAAAVPSAPTGLVSNGDLVLTAATVGYGANASSILSLEDKRLFITTRGGITPRPSWDSRNGSYEGHYRDDIDSNTLQRWSGTAWDPVASPAAWTAFTPRLVSVGSGTDINIGSNPGIVGRYIKLGKRLDFSMAFRWGTQPWNGGTGNIYSFLPAGLVAALGRDQWIGCHLWVYNDKQVADWHGQALIQPDKNFVYPFFPISRADNTTGNYRIGTSAGAAGTGIPLVPNGYPEGGALTINGTIEVQ